MKKAKTLSLRRKNASKATEFVTPWGERTSIVKQTHCNHDWHRDGQTIVSVRRTCAKCAKTELIG